MITPAFGLTATERVLPKLALDFTTAVLDARVTFTRTTGAANPATYINSSGVVTAATDNQPRFDYDPITLACKGLLIEESRANLFLYSEQFQQADWVKSSVTVDDDAIVSPDGATDADKVILDSGVASASGIIRQQITKAASAITYTCSFYAKAGEFNSVRVIFRDTASSANFVQAYFNLNLGTVSTAANAGGTYTNPSASIAAAGNGWYRCALTGTTGTNTTTDMRILQYNNGNSSVTGDGTSGIYIWGAQLETGAFATSYIPTTTTALTRNADVATMTGTNFSDWFNASAGSFVVQFGYTLNPAYSPYVLAGNNDTERYMYINANSNQIRSYDGTSTNSFGFLVNGATNKVAMAYTTTGITMSLNGAATSGPANFTKSTSTTQLQITNNGRLNGHFKKLLYYPQQLTNSELQSFSK